MTRRALRQLPSIPDRGLSCCLGQRGDIGVSQVGILFQKLHPVLEKLAAPVRSAVTLATAVMKVLASNGDSLMQLPTHGSGVATSASPGREIPGNDTLSKVLLSSACKVLRIGGGNLLLHRFGISNDRERSPWSCHGHYIVSD